MSLFSELKRRNVFKVAAVYVIVGWLIMQAGDVMAPAMHLPEWINSALAFFLILGFPIALVLSWALELTPEGIKLEKNVDRSDSRTPLNGRKLDFIIIGLLIVAAGVFALYNLVYQPQHDAETQEASVQETNPGSGQAGPTSDSLSIAVLPFVNMSDDKDNEYFSDGISEELLNVLARFPDLRVAARTSAFQFKGENRDIAEIAQQLRVGHVLDGSVRKAGNRLRITAQLVEAGSGFNLWSESYDREVSDVFAIQDEISGAIAAALKIELRLADLERPNGLPTVPATSSSEAYEYYLKGRQLINGRTGVGIKEAGTVLERALELDENFAPAHAQLAIAIALQKSGSGTYGELSMEEVLDRALPHINRALELEPNLSEAFGARALVGSINFEYHSALENSAKALTLNPSYIDVINWRYITLLNTGLWTEALKLMDHMLSVDPLSVVGRINHAYALARANRFPEARKVSDELLGNSLRVGAIAHGLVSGDYAGDIADSIYWYLQALAVDPDDSFGRHRIAVNFSSIGAYDEALRIAPRSNWAVFAARKMWEKAIKHARQQLADDPQNNQAKLNLANVLHRSGDLAGAQQIYNEMLAANPGFPILDPLNTTPVPTARMAYGAMATGDTEGARLALELLKQDQLERKEAGIYDSFVFRGAAIAAAVEGNSDDVISNLKAAIDSGLRDLSILDEPALAGYTIIPGFKAQAERLENIVDEERLKSIRLICLNNPVPEFWQPLAETCADIGTAVTKN